MRQTPIALALLGLSALVLTAGCNEATSTRIRSLQEHPASATDYQINVTADREAVAAGEAVQFVVQLLNPDGDDVTAEYDVRTQLSPALGVLADGDAIYRFTNIDHYTYFASVNINGVNIVGTAGVEVSAGPAASLSVDADLPLVGAGEVVTMSYEVTDLYGNPVEGTVSWSVDPAAVITGDQVVAETAGHYVVTGQLDGGDAEDSDGFTVEPGDPVFLLINLSSYDVEVGDGLFVLPDIRDAFGNTVDIPLELSTDPVDGTVSWDTFVRFDREGIFNVVAEIPAYGLSDSAGPVLCDSFGPSIRVTEPARGVEIEGATSPTVTVSGSVSDAWTGVVSAELNGDPLSLQPGGLFTYELIPEPGLNGIEIIAVDGDGNQSDHYQSFLWGEFTPVGDFQEDGLLARLNEGAINVLEGMITSLIDSGGLTAGLTGMISDISLGCIDAFVAGVCSHIEIWITSVDIGAMTFNLDPRAPNGTWPDGYLDFSTTIMDFGVNITPTAFFEWYVGWCPLCYQQTDSLSIGAAILADQIDLDTELGLWVDASNVIRVDLANTQVGLSNFRVEIYTGLGIFDDFLNLILGAVFNLFEPIFEALLPPIIESQVPGLVEDALADIEIVMDMDLGGTVLTIAALPQDVWIDDDGITIALESSATAVPGPTAPVTLGSWTRTDGSIPTYGATPDFNISISDNFVNQLLHAVWQGGALDLTMDSASLGLDLSGLGDLVPLSEISFATVPMLPPVVGPGSSGLLELGIGDMLVNVYGDPGGNYGLMMQLAVSLTADAELSIDANDLINFGLSNTVVSMDFVTSDWPDLDGETVEALMDAVVELIIPQITDLLGGIGGIPLPELPGFGLSGASITREPAPAYYITASGALVPVTP